MSFSSAAGGPIASAFVEVVANVGQADEQIDDFIAGLSRIDEAAERAGEGIEDAMREAARGAREDLGDIGGPGTFTGITAQAEIAGERIENSFQEASRSSRVSLSSIGTGLGILAAGLAVAGGAIVAFGVQQAASLEQTQIGFESLLGSAEAADAFIREMQQFAATTPFEFAGLVNTARQLLAVGESAGITREEIIPTITIFGDLVAVLGQNADEAMPRIVRAFGQMASRGKITTEEMLQLTEALPGFPIFQAMAEGLGITTEELQKQLSAGTIPAKEGLEVLLNAMKEFPGAAGAMAKQAETLNGLFSTFKDTISLSLTDAFQPLIPEIKQALKGAIPAIEESLSTLAPALSSIASNVLFILGDILSGFGPSLGTVIQGISDGLGGITEGLANSLGSLRPVFESLAPLFAAVGQALQPVVKLLAQALGTILPPVIDLLTTIVVAITPIIDALGAIGGAILAAIGPSLTRILETLGDVITKLAPPIASLVSIFGGAFVEIFEVLAPILADTVELLAEGLAPVIEALAPVIRDIGEALAAHLVETFTAMAPALPELAEAFGALALALAELLVAVLPILVPLIKLQTLWTVHVGAPVIIAIAQAIAFFATVLAGLITFVTTNAGPAFQTFMDVMRTFWQEVLVPLAQFVAAVFIAPFVALAALFTQVLVSAAQQVASFFMILWTTVLQPVATFIIEVLIFAIRLLVAVIIGPWVIAIAVAIEIWKVLWHNVLVPFATFVATVLTPVIQFVAAVLTGVFKVAIEAVKTAAQFLWQNVLVPIGNFLRGVLSGAVGAATAAWNALKSAVNFVKDAINTAKNVALQPIVNFLRNTAQPVIDAFKSAWNAVKSAVNAAKEAIEAILGPIGDAVDAVGGLISKLGDIPGAGTLGNIVGAIPGLQGGGIINEDTLAALHAPEVVIPLNDPKRALELASASGLLDSLISASSPVAGGHIGGSSGGGGGGITIGAVHVNFQGSVSADDAHAAADAFVDGVEATVRRRQLQFAVRTL